MNLESLPVTHRAVIPEDYLDMMGHMNVMWYTHLFGRSVGSVFKLVGATPEYFRESGNGSFALENHVRYLAEVRVGDAVTIRSRVVGGSAKRMHFIHFMIHDGDGRLAATSEIVCSHVDLRIRRTSPWPEAIKAGIDRVVAEHAALGWDPPLCGSMRA